MNMKKISVVLSLIVICILPYSCKQNPETKEAERSLMKKQEITCPEYTSKYICPMHCEGSGSDHPGKCPVCHMDYELNESIKNDSTDH